MRLKDKWALVTGGSRGIGRGICIELAKEGCNVVVNYTNDSAAAENTVTQIKDLGVKSYCIKTDVADRQQVNDMIKSITDKNELDILISNAGVVKMQPFLEITKDAWDFQLNINLVGSFNIGQETAKKLLKPVRTYSCSRYINRSHKGSR